MVNILHSAQIISKVEDLLRRNVWWKFLDNFLKFSVKHILWVLIKSASLSWGLKENTIFLMKNNNKTTTTKSIWSSVFKGGNIE